MSLFCFSELCEKEVINCCDGSKLGYPCDCEIDRECGKIISLFVKESGKCLDLGAKAKCVVIPWDKIERIGNDLIIVNCECVPCREKEEGEKKKKGFLSFLE